MAGSFIVRGGLRDAFLAAILGLVCAGAAAEATRQPEAASGYSAKPDALGQRFMAVTANSHATDAALDALRAGGSAVDAAIAAQLVLNLVEPQSSGIGGGGFLLHYDARARRLRAYDGRETAPAAAGPQRFLGEDGKPLAFDAAVPGGRSVGVPGLVALLARAHTRHGRLPWNRIFDPAIRLAEQGFAVSPRLHELLAKDPHLRGDPRARALYYAADGSPLPVGHRLTNPEFAATLRELARFGAGRFYIGAIADDLAAAVAADPRSAGDLTPQDLAGYRVIEREPVCGPYRSYRICGMPPPSSGGVTVLQILGMLERLALWREPPLSPASVHWFAEAG